MRGSVFQWFGAALVAAASVSSESAAAPIPCVGSREPSRTLAQPPVAGSLGPFRRVTAVLTRSAAIDRGAFDVRLRLPGGRCVLLAGPEDPNELLLFDVTAVRFAPEGGARRKAGGNALVVLFNSSRIGPGRGSERQALAYRLSASRSGVARSERHLFGDVSGTADVMRRLRRAR